jgi:hypothetical protein
MIEGPGIFICDACVARASRLAAGSAAEVEVEVEVGAAAPMLVEPSGSGAKCKFCEQTRHMQRLVAGSVASAPGGKVGKRPRICDECLAMCEEILAETASL